MYNYSIWANDTSDNSIATSIYQFEIVAQLQITTMLDKWNFVSLPFNQSITKDDLVIINNTFEYNWTEADDEGIILSFIYNWDRNLQTYPGDVLTLEPGYSYWVYAYYDCRLRWDIK